MLQHIRDRFKRKPSKVTLTGQDIIDLRKDVDHLLFLVDGVTGVRAKTLREDVNSALSATAKAIYKLEALEERLTIAEDKITLLLK